MSHFKNVLHRRMQVRSTGIDETQHGCRCCKHARENLQHFASCAFVWGVFAPLAAECGFTARSDRTASERFVLFGLLPEEKIDEGWQNFHLLLWKYTIYQLVLVETEKAKFKAHEIWDAAWRRFERKALAKAESVRTETLRADSRGNEIPDVSTKGRCMEPIATLDKGGRLLWDGEIVKRIKKYATKP